MPRLLLGVTLAAAAALAVGFARMSIQGQNSPLEVPSVVAGSSPGSIQEALIRKFDFNFARPTPLDEVARSLSKSLHVPVAIDRAAIDRLGLAEDDPVQLSLQGVRLKTGLKLLLDQLDLTYRIEPEDNLLIFTDTRGAEQPFERVLEEIKSLHRDVHDLQDAVDEVREAMGLTDEPGAQMRKPTIIEELPADGKPAEPKGSDKPPAFAPGRSRPGV